MTPTARVQENAFGSVWQQLKRYASGAPDLVINSYYARRLTGGERVQVSLGGGRESV